MKPGRPPKFDAEVKKANALTRAEWLDLTQQVWFMYPQDVRRGGNHPAPFPEKLPARLLRLYSYCAAGRFPGEIVLDPFVGTGTTCAVAKRMGRRHVGIDISADYVAMAEECLRETRGRAPLLLVGRAKYPTKEELKTIVGAEAGSAGKRAEGKHKRKTYGRRAPSPDDEQPTLV